MAITKPFAEELRLPTIVWDGDATPWSKIDGLLEDAGYAATVMVHPKSDFTDRVITAGAYDFSKILWQSVGSFASISGITIAAGVTIGTVLYSRGILWSTLNTAPLGSTAGGKPLIIHLEGGYIAPSGASSDLFTATADAGGIEIFLDNAFAGGGGGLFLIALDTAAFPPQIFLSNGSNLGPELFNAIGGPNSVGITADSNSLLSGDPSDPSITYGITYLDVAGKVNYDDLAAAPMLGTGKVQSAIDLIKAGTGVAGAAMVWYAGETWSDFYARLSAHVGPSTVLVEGSANRTIPAGVYNTTGVTFVGTAFATPFGGPYPLITFEDGAQFIRTLRFRNLNIQAEALTAGILSSLPASQGVDILLDNTSLVSMPGAAVPVMTLVPIGAQEHHVYMINNAIIAGNSPSSCIFEFASSDVMTMWAYSGANIGANSFTSAISNGPTIFYDETLTIDPAALQATATYSLQPQFSSPGSMVWKLSESWAAFYTRYLIAASDIAVIYVQGGNSIDPGTYDFSNVTWINSSPSMDFTNPGDGIPIMLDEGVILSPATLRSRGISWHVAATATQLNSGTINFDFFGGGFIVDTAGFQTMVAPAAANNQIRLDGNANISAEGTFVTSAIRLDAGATFAVWMKDNSSMNQNTFDSAAAGPTVTFYVDPTCAHNVDQADTTVVTRTIVYLDYLAQTTVTAGAAYTFTDQDDVVFVNKAIGSATAVTLPDPAASNGKIRYVKDKKGDAATNNITVSTPSGSIDGAPSQTIASNYGSVTLISDGADWNIV